jgi:hypothetical protein
MKAPNPKLQVPKRFVNPNILDFGFWDLELEVY